MKTWKTKRTVCRGRKTGRFANKGKCSAFKRGTVRSGWTGKLFG